MLALFCSAALPSRFETAKSEAMMDDGIPTLTLPETEETKPK